MVRKIRLDDLLVKKKLAKSTLDARKLIYSKKIKLKNYNSSYLFEHTVVPLDVEVSQVEEDRYVSRGGYKLEGFVRDINYSVKGKSCLDIGASTGGFTDLLLQHGAREVICLDSGRDQINYSILQHPKVKSFEGVNARFPFEIPISPVDLAVVDVSFISTKRILSNIKRHLNRDSDLIILIKPQFEAKKHQVKIGGLVKDAKIHVNVLDNLITSYRNSGFQLHELRRSKVKGRKGNQEFFCLVKMVE